jgi:Uncharacterized membrane protein, required for spore maturation in B.subtilis.
LLNIIWPLFIIISVIFAMILGKTNDVTNSIFDSTKQAIEMSISLLGTMCLWSGIMNIASKTSLAEKMCSFLKPFLNIIFPEIKNSEQAKKDVSMNVVANILGLGNAATPLGIKAMETMQKENKNKLKLSNSMAMLILINTASLQLIPTTIIAIRTSMNSQNPTQILIPIWISSAVALISGISIAKVLQRRM